MTNQTKRQNRAACKRAVDLYVNGQKNDARETAKRVSWGFLFNWLVAEEYNCEEYSRYTELNRYRYLTDGIKGEVY